VVGGGNAAADCALALADAGQCASLALSYRRAELARLRGSVRKRFDAAVAAGRIETLFESEVEGIGDDHVVLRARGGRRELGNDAVIVQIGGTAPDELLRGIGIELVEKRGHA
jgi:thioredoxin reductase